MTTSSPESPSGTNRTRVLVALGAVAVLVVALLVWAVARGDDDPSDPSGSESPGTSTSGSSPTAGPTGSSTASPSKGSTTGAPTTAVPTQRPQSVGFEEAGQPRQGVDVEIARVETVRAKAQIPGEVSGPALRLTIRVVNRTDRPVATNNAVSNLYYGPDRTPAGIVLKPGSRRFPPEARPNGEATGVVLFTVPRDERGRLVLEFILEAELRTVEFRGSCPEDC